MAIHTLDWQQAPPADCRGGAVTIGNFDGVHRGHASLLAEVRRRAAAVGGPAVGLTFDPHPLQLLQPDRFLPVLTTTDDRARLLHELGADHVVVLRTCLELLRLTPREFFERVVREGLATRALIEGEDFRFGRDRTGEVDTLARLCTAAGVTLSVVPPLELDGAVVSSSRIRTELERGAVVEAARLLGRPYRLHGTVGTGQQRGRRLGFPTANLEPMFTLAPGDGVYAVRVLTGGAAWPGAANIGPNPTFGEQARKVEVHLIDFSGDLYGQPLAVDFLARLRDTRPFAGVADLTEQLHRDVEQARQLAQAGGTEDARTTGR
ncbi:MAG: bifunctional riboflavin kinase/FAD synthetase [Planctomycetes bacterium]|nr:bifunctional riboflavin kinase/FAD synthetase [Planctomycetota bacterium]